MGYAYGYGYGHTWRPDRRVTTSAAVGGAGLLVGETNGFATDFQYAVDAQRVAVKTAGSVTAYAINNFYSNAGTSPKLVYDVAGVLGWSPHNLIFWSENITTPNRTLFGGTTPTSTFFRPDTTNAVHNFRPNTITTAISGDSITLTSIVSAGGYSKIGYYDAIVGGYISFDLTAGTILSQTAAITSSSITALGGGQYQCTATWLLAAASFRPDFFVLPDSYTTGAFSSLIWVPDGVKGINVFRQQINRGTVPTAYLLTTTAARYGLAVDYDPVTHVSKGLLCEPAATNFAIQSSTFDNASWIKSLSSITANAAIAPNSLTEADKLVEDSTASSTHFIYLGTAVTTGTLSVYAKAAERTQIVLLDQNSVKGDGFNLSNGTTFVAAGVTTTGAPVIQAVGNGWYRCSITATACGQPRIYLASGGTYTYTGNGTSGVYLWGAQLETGTVATSPIPTFAAAITRAVDRYECTPASINYSATEGTWFAQFEAKSNAAARAIGCSAGSAGFCLVASATTVGLYDSTSLYCVGAPTWSAGLVRKVASGFTSGARATSTAGLAATADAGSVVSLLAPGTIHIGHTAAATAINGWLHQCWYLPRKMSNAELSAETV